MMFATLTPVEPKPKRLALVRPYTKPVTQATTTVLGTSMQDKLIHFDQERDNKLLKAVEWQPYGMGFYVSSIGGKHSVRHGRYPNHIEVVTFVDGTTYTQAVQMKEILAKVAHDSYGAGFESGWATGWDQGWVDHQEATAARAAEDAEEAQLAAAEDEKYTKIS